MSRIQVLPDWLFRRLTVQNSLSHSILLQNEEETFYIFCVTFVISVNAKVDIWHSVITRSFR
jgi:hypothetical protein